MKQRVYFETTVVSYFVAKKSSNSVISGHQNSTKQMWKKIGKKFDAFISDLVLQEASKGNEEQAKKRLKAIESFPALKIDDETKELAKKLIEGHAIPREYPEDALHIALAAVNGIDIIVTWNFSHMNNPFTRIMVRQTIENQGYVCPEICSPDELLGE
jgi:PIN domain.